MVRHAFILASLLALFLLVITHNVSSEPYVYDEADYMYAAALGFAANWSDTPSIPIAGFVRAGLDRAGRRSLSERIRTGNDVLFYRHFHGPLFQYLLIPASRLGLSERGVRAAMLAIPATTLAVIYFGCLWLVPHAAIAAALLFLTSYSVIGSTELAPHQLFALCSLGCLILLAKAIATGRRAYWYACIIASGLAFCTLEVACILILTIAICGWVERRRWQADGPFAAQSVGAFLATVLAIWPAAILRLSFLKAYAALAYLALLREAAWGGVGFMDTWRARFLDSPLEWALIGLALLMGFRNRARRGWRLYPMGLFVAFMLAATLRVFTGTPRYSLAFMPVLDLLAGLALVPSFGHLRRPASFAVVALAVAGLYGNAWYQVLHQPHNPNPRSAAVLTYIHQNQLENKSVLAPQADLPALHYYFPGLRVRGYFGPAPTESDRVCFLNAFIIPAARP